MSNFRKELYNLIKTSYLPFGKELSEELFNLWESMLDGYSMMDIGEALRISLATSRFAPTPADVISRLPDKTGHPTPEIAWQTFPKLPTDGAFVTDQMSEAAGICWDAIESGDKMARMAFIEAYKQITDRAKINGERAKWRYSEPDQGSREFRLDLKLQKTHEALAVGKISADQAEEPIKILCSELGKSAEKYLPHLNKNLLAHDPEQQAKIKSRISEAYKAIGASDENR